MSLHPIRDFLLVSINKTDDKLAGGLLYRPATVDDKIVTGTVLEVGGGYLTDDGSVIPLAVKSGDLVLFNKHLSTEVKHNGETLYLMREENILSIVR